MSALLPIKIMGGPKELLMKPDEDVVGANVGELEPLHPVVELLLFSHMYK